MIQEPIASIAPSYRSHLDWNPDRPHILVIACSDGRLQENLDEFLQGHLGIVRYDRMYAPGGPGALTSHGVEFLRSDQFRRECEFLVRAHAIEQVILIFHGPTADGPDEASCADYRRVYPRLNANEIRAQQERDADEIRDYAFRVNKTDLDIFVYRCEVTADGKIQFVEIKVVR